MHELDKEFPIANILGLEKATPEPNSPYEAILRSIKSEGVLSPVLIHKESGTLLAGKSRCLACKELGKSTIAAWLIDAAPDSAEAQLLAIETDLHHKWFSELEQNVLLARQKQLYLQLHPETGKGVAGALAKHGCSTANAIPSFAKVAAQNMNLSERQIQTKVSIGEKISPDVLKECELFKSKSSAKRFAAKQSEQHLLAKKPHNEQLNIIKCLLGTDDSQLPKQQPITCIAQAIEFLKQESHVGKHGYLPDEDFPLVCGDFTKPEMVNLVADKSVSLIATDMPYGEKWLHLLKPLFELYAPKLTEEGHIAIMHGQDSTPQFWSVAMPLADAYGFTFRGQMVSIVPKGGRGSCHNAGLMIHHYKPIAVFAKPHKYHYPIADVIYESKTREKSYYAWQQNLPAFIELLARLSDPSALVFDPMAGSATTGIAAYKTGRKFLGMELEKSVLEVAKTRFIDEMLKAQEAGEQFGVLKEMAA